MGLVVDQNNILVVEGVDMAVLLSKKVVVGVEKSSVGDGHTAALKLEVAVDIEAVGREVTALGKVQNKVLEVVVGKDDKMGLPCMGTGFDREVQSQVGMGPEASCDGLVVVE